MIPQIILFVIICLNLGIALGKHGKEKGKFNFWLSLLDSLFILWLLYWGGFFDKIMN